MVCCSAVLPSNSEFRVLMVCCSAVFPIYSAFGAYVARYSAVFPSYREERANFAILLLLPTGSFAKQRRIHHQCMIFRDLLFP
jgi:hypothetical protein